MGKKNDVKVHSLGDAYWTERYLNDQTGWDIGYTSTPIKAYIDQLDHMDLKILIPGAGNAYEAEYLWKKGFRNVFVADFSGEPLKNLKQRVKDFPDDQLWQMNFFDINEKFDLIIEQTFFSAIHPDLRLTYVSKMHDLLYPAGKLVGLLFNIPLYTDHPPFGGNLAMYKSLLSSHFSIHVMEQAYNSIPPRMGNELFINLSPLKL